MPSTTRRRSRDPGHRASVEAELLAATERLLRAGTRYTDIGVQRIAAEAGVARSTFYTHFRDKIELLVRLMGTMGDASFGVTGTWDPAGPDGGIKALERVFDEVMRIHRAYAPTLAALDEVAGYDITVRDFWAKQLGRFIENTEAVLRAEQRAGRTPADVDVRAASRLIVLGGERFLADHVARNDPAEDAAAARELALTWWYGVYRRRPG